jgi:hypothetical protein
VKNYLNEKHASLFFCYRRFVFFYQSNLIVLIKQKKKKKIAKYQSLTLKRERNFFFLEIATKKK